MAESSNVRQFPNLMTALNGSRRDLLVALRHQLALAFDDKRTQPRDLSPLSLRILELQREISAIDAAKASPAVVTDAAFTYESGQ